MRGKIGMKDTLRNSFKSFAQDRLPSKAGRNSKKARTRELVKIYNAYYARTYT